MSVCSACRAYGPAGRAQYIRFELLDLAICMISYATALSTAISMLARALPAVWRKQQLQLANLLPWAAAAADVAENVAILTMLVTYPSFLAVLAPFAAAATCAKWALLLASVAVVAGLAGCWLCGALMKVASHCSAGTARSKGR